MNLLKILNPYGDVITAISTLLLCIVTYLLYKIGKKNPLMSVYVKHNKVSFQFLDLVIENIGDAPAYDVKIDVIKDLDHPDDFAKLANKNLLIKPKYFAPKQKTETLLTSLIEYFSNEKFKNRSKTIELKVTYFSGRGVLGIKKLRRKKSEVFVIDFDSLSGKSQLGSDGNNLIKITSALEKIQKDFNKLLGPGSINVVTQTRQERRDENEALMKKIRDSKGGNSSG